ncbi:MAG: DnaA N-terminal domain-containing protein, partial [bacterium]
LTRPAFETWFQTATVKEWQNDRLVIQAANPFILNHLQKNYLSTIAEVVEDIVGYPVEIQLTAQQGDSIAIFQPNTSLESELSPSNQLNPKYNFSRFVVGPTNRMAHAAALAVA